jgi:hypothetical protein
MGPVLIGLGVMHIGNALGLLDASRDGVGPELDRQPVPSGNSQAGMDESATQNA